MPFILLIWNFIKGPIGGIVGFAAAAVLGATLVFVRIELSVARSDRDGYKERIENPKTGYVTQVAQLTAANIALTNNNAVLRSNQDQLRRGFDACSQSVTDAANASKARDAAFAATQQQRDARTRDANLLAQQILAMHAGQDVCKAANDIIDAGLAR